MNYLKHLLSMQSGFCVSVRNKQRNSGHTKARIHTFETATLVYVRNKIFEAQLVNCLMK